LEADPKQLVRVFANLAGNAVKFTPRRGRVKFSAEAADGEVRVTVSDTGIGISPRDKERIFSKYYRGAGASGFKGTGLGLTISKAIVEAHGGSIDVESSEGAGSVFTVRLPVAKEP
jgi:signal transduction histidine kinase